MLPKVIQIGPLTFHMYGFIFALSILLGWLVAKKRAHLYKIPAKIFDDPILLIPLVLSIASARAYHVLDYWDVYKNDPGQILNLSGGGLGILGGIAGLLAGLWIVAKVRRINLLSILDLAMPSLMLGQAVGRLGNYVNQEGFGPPTNLPWAIYIDPQNRPAQFSNFTHFHPTFFYEAAIDLLFFLLLIYFESRTKFPFTRGPSSGWHRRGRTSTDSSTNYKPGQFFALYLILYSIGRFIVEFWRIDTWNVGTLKVAHAISIALLLVGLVLFAKFKGVDPSTRRS